MSAYVDSSCIVALAFGEPRAERVALQLHGYEELFSSNLLEAEVRAAARRQGVEFAASWLENFSWVLPERPLSEELTPVLAEGYLRGAGAWHVACALHIAPVRADLDFLTLDRRQADIASALGLSVPDLGAI